MAASLLLVAPVALLIAVQATGVAHPWPLSLSPNFAQLFDHRYWGLTLFGHIHTAGAAGAWIGAVVALALAWNRTGRRVGAALWAGFAAVTIVAALVAPFRCPSAVRWASG